MDSPGNRNVDPAAMRRLTKTLNAVDELEDRHSRIHSSGPASDSRAAVDLASPMGALVWSQALAAFVFALDHARAWRALLIQALMQPMRAHGSLLRGALEGALYSRYLMEPINDPDERLRRACALQLDDYRWRAAFEASAGMDKDSPPPPFQLASTRSSDLLERMHRNGVKPIRLDSPLDLTKRYVGSVWSYQILSAFAHAKSWGLLASDLSDVVESEVPGQTGATVMANDELTVALTSIVMAALHAAIADLQAYAGL